MIIDKENLLSYKQAITATANSDNVLDLGPNMWTGYSGSDCEIPMFLAVDEAFTAAGAATLTITLQSSNDVAFGSGVVTHYTSIAISKASLATVLKQPLGIALPPDVQRYVRATYTVATGPFTAGKLTFGVTASRQVNN
jgi:hypothetical protein